jgi:hypothetical protein
MHLSSLIEAVPTERIQQTINIIVVESCYAREMEV